MTIAALRALGDLSVLTLTLDGEAEGEPIEGIVAVGSVIRTRLQQPKRFGATVADVCLEAGQFSCWLQIGGFADNARVLARAAAIDAGQTPIDAPFRQCRWVASGILNGELRDNVQGATHYVTAALFDSPAAPSWVRKARVVARVGSQVFLIG